MPSEPGFPHLALLDGATLVEANALKDTLLLPSTLLPGCSEHRSSIWGGRVPGSLMDTEVIDGFRAPGTFFSKIKCTELDFPGGSVVGNSPVNAKDTGLISGPERFHMLQGS